MKRWRVQRGLTLIEILLAVAILAIGILGVLTVFPTSYINVVGSGGQSKAASYARKQLETLKNQAFPAVDTTVAITENDVYWGGERGYTGSYSIRQVSGYYAPNRLAHITVTVTYRGRAASRNQTVTLETMRAE